MNTAPLLQDLSDEQASTVTGGRFFRRWRNSGSASASEPTASDIGCLVFDVGGDAVIEFQVPAFLTPILTRSPRISLAPGMPQ